MKQERLMKHLITLAVAVLGLVTSGAAQDYYAMIVDAEIKFHREQFEQAVVTYEETFDVTGKAKPLDLYRAACAWAMLEEPERALEKLEAAIDAGWNDLDRMTQEPYLSNARSKSDWGRLVTKLEQKLAGVGEDLNTSLISLLTSIEEDYLKYRTQLPDPEDDTSLWDEEQIHELHQQQSELDAVNLQRTKAVLDEYGYPSREQVGDKVKVIYRVLLFADPSIQKTYLPLLEKAADRGDLQWSSLAFFVDRLRLRTGQDQWFGTQFFRNPDTGRKEFYTIEAPEWINERRTAIGLTPIEIFAKRHDVAGLGE